MAAPFELKFHRAAGRRIFGRVVEKVREDVAQQSFVGLSFSQIRRSGEGNGATVVRGGGHFIDQSLTEDGQVKRRGPAGQFARLDAAQ